MTAMLRVSVLLSLAAVTIAAALVLRVAALDCVLPMVIPASAREIASWVGAALGLAVLLRAAASVGSLVANDRRQPVVLVAASVALACAVAVTDWHVGAWAGVVVAFEAEGGEAVTAATELPPLDMFLNAGDYVLLAEDGEEAALDLGALPALVRLAAWVQVLAGGLGPALFAAFCLHRARGWWRVARRGLHSGREGREGAEGVTASW